MAALMLSPTARPTGGSAFLTCQYAAHAGYRSPGCGDSLSADGGLRPLRSQS